MASCSLGRQLLENAEVVLVAVSLASWFLFDPPILQRERLIDLLGLGLRGFLVGRNDLPGHHFPALVGRDRPFGLAVVLVLVLVDGRLGLVELLSVLLNVLDGDRPAPGPLSPVGGSLRPVSLPVFLVLQLLRKSLHLRIVRLLDILEVLREVGLRLLHGFFVVVEVAVTFSLPQVASVTGV